MTSSAAYIQADYEVLGEIARRFGSASERTQQIARRLEGRLAPLHSSGWQGEAAHAFFREMDGEVLPATARLQAALAEADRTTQQIVRALQEAEREAAALFEGQGEGADNHDRSLWERILAGASGLVGAVDKLDDFLPIPAALTMAFGLRAGSSYPGQVILKMPTWLRNFGISNQWVRGLAGVENLTHIKATNLAGHLSKGARKIALIGKVIAVAQGTLGVAETWTTHWDEYASYSLSKRVSAMGVDAALALVPVAAEVVGGMGGMTLGAAGGALLGTALMGPGVGTAAGALIGGALGSFAGDWIGGTVGGWATESVENAGGRDWAISVVDSYVAQPVSDAVQAAWERVPEARPVIELPPLSFSL